MPTSSERHALVFLAAVAVVGGGVRYVGVQRFEQAVASGTTFAGGRAEADSGRAGLSAQIDAVDFARDAAAAKRSGRLGKGGRSGGSGRRSSLGGPVPTIRGRSTEPSVDNPLDVNRATAEELERLPRVGPALAQRIVARRDSVGPFGSLEDLRHVRGIGAVTAAQLAPLVTFDGWHRPLQSGSQRRPDESHPTFI